MSRSGQPPDLKKYMDKKLQTRVLLRHPSSLPRKAQMRSAAMSWRSAPALTSWRLAPALIITKNPISPSGFPRIYSVLAVFPFFDFPFSFFFSLFPHRNLFLHLFVCLFVVFL